MVGHDVTAADRFLAARDFLLRHRGDYDTACRWPQAQHFNWALDYFDRMADGNARPALWIVNEDGTEFRASFAEMRTRADRAGNFLRALGVKRGDRILLMLGNVPPPWEVMLAAIKPGAMGRPLPGYRVALLDIDGREGDDGELPAAAAEAARPDAGLSDTLRPRVLDRGLRRDGVRIASLNRRRQQQQIAPLRTQQQCHRQETPRGRAFPRSAG
jgi:acetyl-CoA synthetase